MACLSLAKDSFLPFALDQCYLFNLNFLLSECPRGKLCCMSGMEKPHFVFSQTQLESWVNNKITYALERSITPAVACKLAVSL